MLEHAVLGCSLLETLDVRSCLKVYLFLLLELQLFFINSNEFILFRGEDRANWFWSWELELLVMEILEVDF
jgi:hypothetical protein